MPADSLFKWHRFLPEIILPNMRWYCRYSLTYRDLEEMMAERGVEVVSFGASQSEHIPQAIVGC